MTPNDLERQFTLLTAAARHDQLRAREALAPPSRGADSGDHPADDSGDHPADDSGDHPADETADDTSAAPLTLDEALELLALSEVIARKAGYGRQLTVRSARQAGASWSQIGAALGTSKQAAWEAHSRWIDGQAEQHRRSGYEGLDETAVAAARALAGDPESA
jgi:hypothetical protein